MERGQIAILSMLVLILAVTSHAQISPIRIDPIKTTEPILVSEPIKTAPLQEPILKEPIQTNPTPEPIKEPVPTDTTQRIAQPIATEPIIQKEPILQKEPMIQREPILIRPAPSQDIAVRAGDIVNMPPKPGMRQPFAEGSKPMLTDEQRQAMMQRREQAKEAIDARKEMIDARKDEAKQIKESIMHRLPEMSQEEMEKAREQRKELLDTLGKARKGEISPEQMKEMENKKGELAESLDEMRKVTREAIDKGLVKIEEGGKPVFGDKEKIIEGAKEQAMDFVSERDLARFKVPVADIKAAAAEQREALQMQAQGKTEEARKMMERAKERIPQTKILERAEKMIEKKKLMEDPQIKRYLPRRADAAGDVKIRKESIELIYKNQSMRKSRFTLSFNASPGKKNEMVASIPKDIAASAYDIDFETPPDEILEEDPVVKWVLSDIPSAQAIDYSFTVDKDVQDFEILAAATQDEPGFLRRLVAAIIRLFNGE